MAVMIARRLGSTVFVLFGVVLIVFLLLQLVPGDPARTILGAGATEDAVEAVRRELGLDQSVAVQFFSYLGGLLTGDFGRSLTINQPVLDIILPRFQNTMVLSSAALFLCIVIGVPLGIIAARKQYGVFDRVSMFVSLAGASVPVYWLGLMLIGIFSLQLGLFPTSGMSNPRNSGGGISDNLVYLVLPAIAAASVPLAVIARMTRSVMVDTMEQDYIRTLRASGIPERSILWRHCLRNALPPIVTVVGLQIGYLLGGVIFVEVVFSWPGLGYQLYTSITQNDMPLVQAGVLFIALVFVIVNLLTDTAVGLLDPRTRRKVMA
ncbi:ABC transporter permease [Dietzia cercidiphylli]|uniref:ABC transporter permease n=1 Tax=Dietzia TaxID=37914 RepID=UPI0015FC8F38|nr:ABC transporter permease [Dietzia sp. B19]MBB1058530.1 ABC transporter permease [Dietzia sp. B19]